MPIRFACPSCQQPIEIDDQWAGQSVACPYCKRVVTAPTTSTWPVGEIPMASPARGTSPPPPPPGGYAFPQPTADGRKSGAPLALTLVLLSGLITFIAAIVFSITLMEAASERAGTATDRLAIQRAAEELVTRRLAPRNSFTTPALLVAIGTCLLGTALAVRSLAAREPRRGMAAVAAALGVLLLCFELILAAGTSTASAGYVPTSPTPSATQTSTAE